MLITNYGIIPVNINDYGGSMLIRYFLLSNNNNCRKNLAVMNTFLIVDIIQQTGSSSDLAYWEGG